MMMMMKISITAVAVCILLITTTSVVNASAATTTTVVGVSIDDQGRLIWRGNVYEKSAAAAAATAATAEPPKCEKVDEHVKPSSSTFWVYVGICGGLVMLAGVMSGLTVGLFSIDPLKLSILQLDKTSRPIDKERAESLQSLLQNHHLLLVTLLIVNAAAMESLPIFLDKLVGPIAAIALSVSFVLLFGEIIPQAVCTKNPLRIGAMFAPLVRVLIVLTYPLSWPIAKLLDWLLGHESSTVLFKRSEIQALCMALGKDRGGVLIHDEVTIMRGALALKEKTVAQCMTPADDVFMLASNATLNNETMGAIMACGYSRIPISRGDDRNDVIGLALVKRLILVNPDENRCIKEFAVRRPVVVPPSTPMFDMLNIFQNGLSHMALVTNDVDAMRARLVSASEIQDTGVVAVAVADDEPQLLGIITLEDVVEELIQEEVIDETDGPYREMMQTLVRRDRGVRRAVDRFKLLLHRRALKRQLPNSTPSSLQVIAQPPIRSDTTGTINYGGGSGRSGSGHDLEEAPLLEYHRMEDDD